MKINSDRIIFHVDGDAFFASVEETVNPELKKVPMAVCGDPKSRHGIILAKNQLANKYGVKTAETIWKAKQKCPDLVFAPARHSLYNEFCERLNILYQEYTSQVERLSIDESFLDITGSLHLFGGNSETLANEIRLRVEKEIGITVSVGVSFNKIFAKMASDLNKPNGVTIITKDNFKKILWPMPAKDLYTVGKVTANKLNSLYIKTIGDIAVADPVFLKSALGNSGLSLYHYANGHDNDPVLKACEDTEVKSVGNGRTFKRNLISLEDIKIAVIALSDTVASRLRKKEKKCATIQVTIKDPKFKVITRQTGVDPTWLASDISKEALDIIKKSWRIGSPIRMLTITASNLVAPNEANIQISFFNQDKKKKNNEKQEMLEKTMDKIRDKYGADSILISSIINNDLGIKDKYTVEEVEDEIEE